MISLLNSPNCKSFFFSFADHYVVKQGTNMLGSAENKISITLSRDDLGAIYECQASSQALHESLKVNIAVKVHGKLHSPFVNKTYPRKEENMSYANSSMQDGSRGVPPLRLFIKWIPIDPFRSDDFLRRTETLYILEF